VPVTISNSSGFSIGSLVLAVNAPFAVSQSTCSSSLATGASCSATLLFEPTVTGVATGALTISSPDLSGPINVALSGTGFDFATAISGSSSLTVSAGQTANFGLTINPSKGVAGTFTFACGTLPAYAKCVFNPATTTIPSGATGSVTLSVSTGTAGTAMLDTPAGWRLLPLTCGVLLLPWTLLRRRKVLLMGVLLALFVVSVSSCASSGGGSGGGGGGREEQEAARRRHQELIQFRSLSPLREFRMRLH
jgi:hypothetical protein